MKLKEAKSLPKSDERFIEEHPLKRRLFSLVEVMAVLVLVALVAGVTAYSIIPLYRTFRFQLEVNTLYELMQELQLEAMTLQSDIQLKVIRKDRQWSAASFSDERVLQSQTVDLTYLDLENPFTITFYSTGFIQPQTMLHFSYREEHRWLDFSHPLLIKLWKETPKFESLPLPDYKHLKAESEKK